MDERQRASRWQAPAVAVNGIAIAVWLIDGVAVVAAGVAIYYAVVARRVVKQMRRSR
jgi:EamA domain-containing membrane protein RarD